MLWLLLIRLLLPFVDVLAAAVAVSNTGSIGSACNNPRAPATNNCSVHHKRIATPKQMQTSALTVVCCAVLSNTMATGNKSHATMPLHGP